MNKKGRKFLTIIFSLCMVVVTIFTSSIGVFAFSPLNVSAKIKPLTNYNGNTITLINDDIRELMDMDYFDWTYIITLYEEGENNYEPNKVILSWEEIANSSYFNVKVATDRNFNNVVDRFTVIGKNQVCVSVPLVNTEYFWQVETEVDGEKIVSGIFSFKTADTPRTLLINGVTNTRDLGGYTTSLGWNSDKTQNYAEYPAALYGVPYSLMDVGLFEYLEPSDGSASNAIFYTFKEGEWTTARIDISKLLIPGEQTLKGMKFCVAGDLYIDEIWYDNYEFVPENMGEGVLADFDDPNWIYQTQMGLIGDPPALEVLFDGYHGADGKNGVLKISAQTASSNAVADIKLFETINVNEHPVIYFRIFYDGSVQGSLLYKSFLVFQNSKLTSHQDNRLYYHLIDSTNSDLYTEQWLDIAVDSTVFGGYGDTFDTVSILLEGSVYIDKIWVE